MLRYTETPVVEIVDAVTQAAQIKLLIKREDLNHPHISGNKWWKLKYNLTEAVRLGSTTLLTFGGAYSNHIYATAAAAHELNLKSIGVIRGEETLPLNDTLSFATAKGMQLHYMSRGDYKNKDTAETLADLKNRYGDFYLIPEGGTNEHALKGIAEFGESLLKISFDYLCIPVGTGGTTAGLIESFKGERKIVGFPVLKNGDFLNNDINQWLSREYSNWHLETDYHFGGYGKTPQDLLMFIKQYEADHDLLLDPIYTGKMMAGLYEMIAAGKFERGTTVLVVHSGGLQGWGGVDGGTT